MRTMTPFLQPVVRLSGLFAVLCAGAHAAENLVPDPGFETRQGKWYLRALKSPSAPDQMTYVTDRPHSGAVCMRVADQQTNSGHYLSLDLKVPAGAKTLLLTFFVRADEPHAFNAGILFNSGDNPVRFLGAKGSTFQAGKDWQKHQITAPVPEGAATINLLLAPTEQKYEQVGTVFFDDVSVEVVPDTPAAGQLGIDREPRPRFDAPYTPAEGATALRNPPSFVFPTPNGWAPGKFTYTVEWSKSPEFPAGSTGRMTNCRYHVNIPGVTLEPGKWFWRYGIENQPGGTAWSKARGFTVTADAPAMAWPDLPKVLAAVSKENFRSYVTPADLPAIRERAQNGDLKELVTRMRGWLDGRIGEELQPEPPFLPPRDSKEYTAEFVKVMRSMTFYRMESFALMYLMTGEAKYGNEAKRRLLHFYGKWDPRGSTSLRNNDEPGMHINTSGLPSYEMTRELFTPEERRIVENSMAVRMNEIYDYLSSKATEAHPFESHSIYYYQLMGRLALTLIHDNPDAARCFDLSLRYFWTYLHPYAAPDGGWSEGPGYGSWGVERLARYSHVVKMNTGIDLRKIHPFFLNCGYYPLYGWPGPSRQTSFGDGTAPESQASMLRICAALNNNPVFLKPGLDRKQPTDANIWTVLTDRASLGKPDMTKLPKAICFDSIGFVALRTDLENFDNDVGLIFQSNPYGAVSHHHNCHNCFMLEAYGEPLAISSGYYDHYDSAHHAGWTRETKSRNGITVDGGRGQMRGGHAAGKIIRFETGPDFDIVTGDASKAYDVLDTSLRTIVHVRPGFFVIRDRAAAPKEHVFEYNLHAFQPGSFDEKTQTAVLKMPKAELKVLFLADAPWKFRSFDRFPIAPERSEKRPHPEQWHFVASAPGASKTLDLITVLLPYRTGEADRLPEVEKLPDGVRFLFRDGKSAEVRFDGDRVMTRRD